MDRVEYNLRLRAADRLRLHPVTGERVRWSPFKCWRTKPVGLGRGSAHLEWGIRGGKSFQSGLSSNMRVDADQGKCGHDALREDMHAAPLTTTSTPSPFFVAVGASGADGLRDLRDLLEALPAELPAVLMVVLHRSSNSISHLQEVLARRSALPVIIPQEADEYRAGACYIGEPAAHLSLAERSRVHLIAGAHNRYRNRTVDLLFESVAAHAGRCGIGVVLRGSLSDGAKGLASIHFAGGTTMVLGSRYGAVCGMPRNATEYDGPIDFTGSVQKIAEEIVRRVRERQSAGAITLVL